MKRHTRTSVFLIAAGVVFLNSGLVHAESMTESPRPAMYKAKKVMEAKRAEMKERVEDRKEMRVEKLENREVKKEERKEVREERREERQEGRQEFRSNVAVLHAERLEQSFGRYFTHLTNAAEKLQAEITKKTAAGKDMKAAQAKLAEATAKTAEAKKLGDAAIAAFKAIDPAKFSEQRDAAFAARDMAKDAREAYVEALKLLKDTLKHMRQAQ